MLKYITINVDGLNYPHIFPEDEAHDRVAQALTHGNLDNVLGAGFISINQKTRQVHAYGQSISLKKGPHKDDDYYLTKMFFPE